MVKVDLTSYEMLFAANIGITRQVANLKKGRKDAHGAGEKDGWRMHIEGAMGELVVAKVLNIYWSGDIGVLYEGDVGGLEVRTRSSHSYDLIVYPNDKDESLFILVTGLNGKYRVHGYMKGADAKQEKWWAAPNDRWAYFIKKKHLHPIEDLASGPA